MGGFSRFLSLIFCCLIGFFAPIVHAKDDAEELLQSLASAHRFTDVFTLCLQELSRDSCLGKCKARFIRNAARSLIQIGDFNGAITYLHICQKDRECRSETSTQDLFAYSALRNEDLMLWGQYSEHLGAMRSILADKLVGPNSYLPATRRSLLAVVDRSNVPAEINQALLSYGSAGQISPWLTGGLSAIVPGSGMLVLGMGGSAAQSFLLTAVSGWATSDLARRKLYGPALASALITSVFYIGGIQATVRSTNETNYAAAASERAQVLNWVMPGLEFEWKTSF